MNGRRDAGLILNVRNGSTNGSHVNFTCNPFFERTGRERVFCIDGEWEKERANCRLTKNICRNKPQLQLGLTIIKSLSRAEPRLELEYGRFENITVYTSASYICTRDSKFQDRSRVAFKNFNGVILPYQNSSCIGQDEWEQVPVCS